jgi:iron complex outermembrane receptor protein
VKSASAFRLSLALMLVLQAFGAHAQVSEEEELTLVYGDKSIVSIATGSQQSLRRAPAVASVITSQDIEAMGATDLDQVLESVAGVHVNRSANQFSPLYVVRGIFSSYLPQVLILQNGIPMTTLYHGNKGNIWAGFPVEHIARIEVIRGPGSALYGSDAYSGVINIITKNARDAAGTEIGARLGSFNTRDAWIQHGGSIGAVDVAAYLRVGSTDGFRRTVEADAQTRNDALYGTSVSLAPGPANTFYDAVDANLDIGYGKWRLRAGLKLRDDVGTAAGISSALDPVGRSRSERANADLSWTDPQFGRDWSVGAMFSSLYYAQIVPVVYQLYPPGVRFPTGTFEDGMRAAPETWERSLRLSGYAAYSGFTGHNIRIGIGHDDLDLYRTRERRNFTYAPNGLPIPLASTIHFTGSNSFMLPQRRKVNYVYVQDEWAFAPDWTMTAGLRHDRYSDFGSTTNPRLALVWDASLDLTAKLMYGRAFRAPAFLEYYGIASPVALGNPTLRPETNGTLEAAFNWQARPDTKVNLTLYRYSMSDIIRTIPNALAGTGTTYHNTGDQVGRGLELETEWTASRALRVIGNYSYQRSEDKLTARDAGYAPRHHLYSRVDWQLDNFVLGSQLNWVAKRARPAGDLRKPIDDYTTLDLSLRSQRGRSGWEFAASLRNLFNADVREPSLGPGLQLPNDLPMAGRSFSLQASYQL